MDFTFSTQLHYLIHFVDEEYVAHCLDMDLVGTGDSIDDAIDELNSTVRSIVYFAVKSEVFDILSLTKSAPERYWELFEGAKKKTGVQTRTLDVGSDLEPVTVKQCRHFTYCLAVAA
jgi:hypothetical protein